MSPEQLVEWQRYMEKSYAELSTRLGEVEKGFAVFQAVAKEQQNFIQDKLNRVQDNINQTKKDLTEEIAPVKSGISKLMWGAGLAVVAAIVHWLLKGCLFIVN